MQRSEGSLGISGIFRVRCLGLGRAAAPLGNTEQRKGHGSGGKELQRAGSAAGKPSPQILPLILARLLQHS